MIIFPKEITFQVLFCPEQLRSDGHHRSNLRARRDWLSCLWPRGDLEHPRQRTAGSACLHESDVLPEIHF